MKNFISLTAVIFGLLFISVVQTSCKKDGDDVTGPMDQLIARSWYINRIQLKIYSGSSFIKDSIIPQTPQPKNFVSFGPGSSFSYCYNTKTVDTGTYTLSGDVVTSTTPANVYSWKVLTLTKQLFTAESTVTTDPDFPGLRVERYFTFVPDN